MTIEHLRASLAERYALESELGQGGMATVYLARDLKHDRQVAVKVLRPELAAILGRERFLAEVRLTAKLDHPHILTLLDSGESEGFVWYTLPYIRGESLRHKLERETQLSVDEAVSITRQIAGALEHAHQHGIIHRDVKPDNILLHEGEAMLADFGIALAVKEAGGQRLTETGLSLGTPQYMSPEQATAERTLDARSDIYSLGAVLYEMLAGEPPFTGATGQAVIAKLMVQDAMSLRIVRKTIPTGLEAVVSRALAKVPADRFPSAAAFAAALAAPETHRPPRRVPKRALLVAGVAGVALAVITTAMVWLMPVMRSGRAGTMVGEPTLRRVTLTGNAVGPAISPDGKQLAYGEQTCRSPRDCDEALVVANLGSGERKTVVDRFEGGMGRMTWSPDQRFLLVGGTRGGQDGLNLASLFSGEVRYLGEYFLGQFLGGPDTIIAMDGRSRMKDGNPSLATRWFPVLTADGAVVDSIPYQVTGFEPWPLPSPDGHWILIWSYSNFNSDKGHSLYLIDRAGRLTDSLPTLSGFHAFQGLQWTASGDGVLVLVKDNSAPEPNIWTLLRFAVTAEGRVRLPPDTVARRLRLAMTPNPRFQFSPPSRTGTIAVELGEPTYSIAKLERPSLAAAPVRTGKLVTATGGLAGRISPNGESVLVRREATLDGEPATQLEVWPFDSGSGTPLGPPRKGLRSAWWSSDGSTIYRLAKGAAPGQLDFSRIEVASGRPLETHPVQDSIEFIYDSLLLYLSVGRGSDGTPRELRSWTRAGGSPLVFSFPDTAPHMNAEIVSPDGRGSWLGALITSKGPGSGGPPRTFTLYIARPGVPAARFPPFEGPWADLTFIHSGPGPVFEILADGFDGSLRRLLLEPGRSPRDVGPWPLPRTPFPLYSDNGRRGVVGESELRTDIWLLEWPGADSARAR